MNRGSLTFRLAFAFAFVAIATAAISAVVIMVTWQRQFEVYIERGVEERALEAADYFGTQYERAGDWQTAAAMGLLSVGVSPDLRIEVFDAEGTLIAHTVAPGGTTEDEAAYEWSEVTASADILVDDGVVGTAIVTQRTRGGIFTERDTWFRKVSLLGLAVAAGIAVALASLAGVLYSRGIVKPIEAVTRTAESIRAGDRTARTGMTGGDPVADLGATFDQMADAVEAERRFEQQLTADVAHELRTPLQAIQATVEAMQDGVLPTDEERLALIHDETVRLGRLTQSIMELSRLETGSAPFAFGVLDAAGPVGTAVESSRALMESTGHALEASLQTDLTVNADADRLMQAVGNLLSNAARYTPEGGTVRVRLLRDGAEAVIEVADSGMGVAEDDRERVFTRFWRADPARNRASGGLGIGLAVVREIVERHGGRVGVHGSDLGGAAFVIRLPLAGEKR
ncbi:MAG: HAMP domain-containing protein [Coriobacteriia bacterium]|nr:HAMP domain-containing protein [Coriobacteriia bacterium]MBN2841099.1 HAMP domain-containing protein [Coriobacteriia bacterium]